MDTAELKGLLDKATKGPWTPYLDAKCVQIDFDGKNGVRPCVVGWGGFDSNDLPMRENRANAALICALRNNAEELIASAERVARLEAALRDSDCHDGGNVGKCVDKEICTCVMKDLLGGAK